MGRTARTVAAACLLAVAAAEARAQQAPASQESGQGSQGGGQMAVDLVAAEKALNQTLIAQGFALLPSGGVQIEPAFTYARNEISFPSFLNTGGALGTTTVANAQLRQNNYIGDIAVRAGLPFGTQVEVDVPYRYLDQRTNVTVGLAGQTITGTGSGGGMSDVTATLYKQVLTEGPWRPDVIAAVQYSANTGGVVDGFDLGNGFPLVRGLLTAVKQVDPIALAAGLGFGKGLPAPGISPGNEFDTSFGAYLSASPETTLRLQLNQRFLTDATHDGTTLVGSGLTQATLVAGVAVIVAPHTLLDVSVGVGLTSDTPKYFLRVSLPITFSVL
ncbi:MAG: hypothetical protein M0Z28_13740 [Rhodospirillales bacterium]|nr:hypothetical protein [Rhodospirillales bacterium]